MFAFSGKDYAQMYRLCLQVYVMFTVMQYEDKVLQTMFLEPQYGKYSEDIVTVLCL